MVDIKRPDCVAATGSPGDNGQMLRANKSLYSDGKYSATKHRPVSDEEKQRIIALLKVDPNDYQVGMTVRRSPSTIGSIRRQAKIRPKFSRGQNHFTNPDL